MRNSTLTADGHSGTFIRIPKEALEEHRFLEIDIIQHATNQMVTVAARASRKDLDPYSTVTRASYSWMNASWQNAWWARLVRWADHQHIPLPEALRGLACARQLKPVLQTIKLDDDVLEAIAFQAHDIRLRFKRNPDFVLIAEETVDSLLGDIDFSATRVEIPERGWSESRVYGIPVRMVDWLPPGQAVVI